MHMAKLCLGLYYEHKSKGRTVKKMVKMLQGGRPAAPARTRAEKRARGRQRRRRVLTKLNQSKSLYLFLIPAIVYFIIFCYLPMYGVQIAFKYYSPRLGIWGSAWTGMENLNRFFDSYYFWRLLRNTVGLSLYNLIVAFPFPILLALVFNEVKSPKLKKAVQTISYAPHFISVVGLVGMVLAAVMLCGVLAGCGGTQSGSTPASGAQSASAAGDSNVNAEGFPIVNEPITLRGMVALNANVKDWNEHPALKRMEELTGIHIEWECVPDAGFTEKRNLAFASDDLPDIILRAKISPQEEMKYAANGQLVALDEYLDYAPNLSALIEQDDAIRKGITMPDGHIYSCPQLNKTEGNLIHHYWINKTWLDNLGLEAPTTVDELYDVLVAFRDNDPNGNGQKDEIPYCVVGKDYPHRMFYDLLGSWGFGINGVMDSDYAFSWLDIDDAGKVRFIGREDKFKNMVEFYNKLWTEGLVDKESYSQDQTQAAAKVNAGQVGFVARAQNTQWMGAAAENYVQCPVLEGPYGDRALINVESNVQMTGVAVITTANKYPEATMRWLDYFYSEEGTVLCRLGIEGESYEVVDGKYQLLDNIKNNPDGLTLDQALGQWAIFPGGYLPQYITNEVDQSAAQLPETKAANDAVRDYVVPFETVPRVKFTEEESIKLGTYAQDIVNYATENVVKFITGEKSLSEWDAYVAELNNMPVEDYIKINQDAYDRWKG